MKRRSWALALLLVVLGGFYVWRQAALQAPSSVPTAPPAPGAEPNPGSPSSVPTESPSPSLNEAGSEAASAASVDSVDSAPSLQFPTLEQVRREVEANPHATPPSLIEFAKAMAPRMEEALQSQDPRVVKRMVFALKGCALSDSNQAVPQVQALCVTNLKRLAEAKGNTFPGIEDAYREVGSRASPDARRLLNAADRMQSGH